jgi:hypothetical protein
MVFIDDGHSEEMAQGDYESWAPLLPVGCPLAVHDVSPTRLTVVSPRGTS